MDNELMMAGSVVTVVPVLLLFLVLADVTTCRDCCWGV